MYQGRRCCSLRLYSYKADEKTGGQRESQYLTSRRIEATARIAFMKRSSVPLGWGNDPGRQQPKACRRSRFLEPVPQLMPKGRHVAD